MKIGLKGVQNAGCYNGFVTFDRVPSQKSESALTGTLKSFARPNHFGTFRFWLNEVRNGKWLLVYPAELSASGVRLIAELRLGIE